MFHVQSLDPEAEDHDAIISQTGFVLHNFKNVIFLVAVLLTYINEDNLLCLSAFCRHELIQLCK